MPDELKEDTIFSLAFRDVLQKYPKMTIAQITKVARQQGSGLTRSRMGLFKNGRTNFWVKNLESILAAINSIEPEALDFYLSKLAERAEALPIAELIEDNSDVISLYHLIDLLEDYSIGDIEILSGISKGRLQKIFNGAEILPDEVVKIDNLVQKHLKTVKSLLV